jgi:hypothetical protein
MRNQSRLVGWLKSRWLEVVLLVGLAALLAWYANLGLAFVPKPTPTPLPAPTRTPAPTRPVRTWTPVPTQPPPTATPTPLPAIDFDYPYWHTVQDTADKVSPASLERMGRVLQTYLEKTTQEQK